MPGGADREALRRRLYRSDATEQDLARYRTAVDERPEEGTRSGPPKRPAATAVPARTRRPALLSTLVAIVGGGAVVVAAVVLTTGRPATAPAAPTRTAAAAAPDPVAISAASRLRLAGRVQHGDPAALSGFFLDHPESIPEALRGTRRADTQETPGTGDGMVGLDPSGLAMRGGRVTVVLVLDQPGTATWQALRDVTMEPHAATWRVVDRRTARYGAALPLAVTFAYQAAPPTRLRVTAPSGAHWSAAVVFTN